MKLHYQLWALQRIVFQFENLRIP